EAENFRLRIAAPLRFARRPRRKKTADRTIRCVRHLRAAWQSITVRAVIAAWADVDANARAVTAIVEIAIVVVAIIDVAAVAAQVVAILAAQVIAGALLGAGAFDIGDRVRHRGRRDECHGRYGGGDCDPNPVHRLAPRPRILDII